MDHPFKSPVVLSFCPGLRGLERGLERAIGPVRTIAYVEIEAFVIENLVCQMEQGLLAPAPIWSDIKTFPWEHFHRKVHGFIGGYPCQPFSHVGRMGGEQDPRNLWPFIKNGIAAVRPLWCWFENVSNHINIGYEQVRADLFELGYTVKEGIFSAEEIGAPHIRKRLFILALDNTLCRRYRRSKEQICTGRIGAQLSGQTMDNTINQGLEGHTWDVNDPFGQEGRVEIGSATATGFPLGQGYEQYDWEHRRTTKSGVGCTIDGYNFRDDLLRAYGNSVVEQTAEIAFIDLLKKHFN